MITKNYKKLTNPFTALSLFAFIISFCNILFRLFSLFKKDLYNLIGYESTHSKFCFHVRDKYVTAIIILSIAIIGIAIAFLARSRKDKTNNTSLCVSLDIIADLFMLAGIICLLILCAIFNKDFDTTTDLLAYQALNNELTSLFMPIITLSIILVSNIVCLLSELCYANSTKHAANTSA